MCKDEYWSSAVIKTCESCLPPKTDYFNKVNFRDCSSMNDLAPLISKDCNDRVTGSDGSDLDYRYRYLSNSDELESNKLNTASPPRSTYSSYSTRKSNISSTLLSIDTSHNCGVDINSHSITFIKYNNSTRLLLQSDVCYPKFAYIV